MILAEGMQVVLWGAKGHARVLAALAQAVGASVLAVGDRDHMPSPLTGIPMIQGRDDFATFLRGQTSSSIYYGIAIGGNHGADRLSLAGWMEEIGLFAASFIHPTAYVEPTATLAEGVQLLAHSYVGANATVGRQTILNTKASLDHDSVAGDGVHLAPGSTVCGDAVIKDRAFVASSATVLPRLTVGEDTTVGAGAVVVRSVPKGQTVAGVPARIIER